MGATAIEDSYADLQAKIEESIRIQNTVVGEARAQNRDVTDAEYELIKQQTERIKGYRSQAAPLVDQISVAAESRQRSEELSQALTLVRRPDMAGFSYRSAGHYVLDNVKAIRGDRDARERLEFYNRVAAHQTTTNAAGVVPQEVVGPVINFIDSARPLVTALGVRPLEGGPNFYRPRVTTHTSVAKQSAEKAEFSSTAMVLDRLTATVDTYGGYVNVSRQIIDWSSPAIMDIVVQDLAAQYAIQTETAAAAQFLAAATAGTVIPTGATTADAVPAAVWAAVGTIYTTIPNAGRIVAVASPAMLAVIGPALTATAINNPNVVRVRDRLHVRPDRLDRRRARLSVATSRRHSDARRAPRRGRGVRPADRHALRRRAQRGRCPGRLHGLLLRPDGGGRRHRQDHQDAMTEPEPTTDEPDDEPEAAPDYVPPENENGLVLSMACPNAYVVGVTIVEGQEPAEEDADTEAAEG